MSDLIVTFSFLTLLILFAGLFFYSLNKVIFKGNLSALLVFFIFFLSCYLTLQILSYQVTQDLLLGQFFKAAKDAMILLGLFAWVIYRKNIWNISFYWTKADKIGFAFITLVIIFWILPIGPASAVNKLIYFKNTALVVIMYFLGRNMVLERRHIYLICHSILVVVVLAFLVGSIEQLTNTHIQTLIGYEAHLVAEGGEPTGEYGLTWTFQAASGAKRFAAFFAAPLELGVFANLAFATSFILFKQKKEYRTLYLLTAIASVACLLYSHSRAPLAGFFLMLLFLSYVFGYFKYLVYAFLAALFFVISLYLFGSKDLWYFFIDTLTLSDSSSAGHVLEWLIGLESIVTHPEGIGLAMSGDAGGVIDDIHVGGENQFIIYGVQLGIIGLFLYIMLVYYSIKYPLLAFRKNKGKDSAIIPFIATTFKVSFLVSLMVANAENYVFVTLFSWWAVGYSIQFVKSETFTKKMHINYGGA